MPRRLALVLATLVLSACATAREDTVTDTRSWIFNGDDGPRLAYGTPQSDDIGIMLSCVPKSGQISVSQGGLKPGQGITIASGAAKVTLRGTAEDDQLNGGVYMTALTPLHGPVMQTFRDIGRLSVGEVGRMSPMDATPAERGEVARFFAACEA